MDGTFAGDGPGPRAMNWHTKNVIIASGDSVAMDAVAAKMMGFDPLKIKFIRIAHEAGLGVGDVRNIQIVGDNIGGVNWKFSDSSNTLFSLGQKSVYWGPLRSLEMFLTRSPLINLGIAASNAYHNAYWMPLKGRKRVKEALLTEWGSLFQSY